ncbi:leucine-rich repeat extensin-like protein 5 [Penaeus chinensis]|uniref:leucine-rich repeat extensin-like protein 5 n=1 Tax=Penaeus chinensis TaxID=139456 RepID=UPI001FB7F1AB|nr:leucine-rich repeat extensin-like protein 5 [Penaeus chinensis]
MTTTSSRDDPAWTPCRNPTGRSIVSPIQLSQPSASEASPTPESAQPSPSPTPSPATGKGPQETPAGRAGAPCLRLTQFPSSPPSPAEDTGGLVTLHSLGSWRDSGYVPSPSSAHSFTFSSDEDEPMGRGGAGRRGRGPPPFSPSRTPARPLTPKAIREEVTEEKQEAPEDWTPPSHGRNWSTPATTPDGRPILMPTPAFTPTPLEARAASSRSSRARAHESRGKEGKVIPARAFSSGTPEPGF